MKIYTKTGDLGQTTLFGGRRVSKAHLRVEAYGSVDELNSVIGFAIPALADPEVRRRVALIQADLFAIGSHLATPPAEPGRPAPKLPPLPSSRIEEMESWMDQADVELPPLRNFILPGGAEGAARLHIARTACRRSERMAVHLGELDTVDPAIYRYLNRLSDLLFMMARLENHRAGTGDVEWSGTERVRVP